MDNRKIISVNNYHIQRSIMKLILSIIFILFAAQAYSQKEYKNEIYNFKITIPDDWEVVHGKKNIVFEASSGIYLNLYVQAQKLNISDSVSIYYMPIDTLKKRIEKTYAHRYTYYEVLQYGKNIIDFVDAYYFFVKYASDFEGFSAKFISYQYQFIYNKIFYSLIITCPQKNFPKYEVEFNKIFSTFAFLEKK